MRATLTPAKRKGKTYHSKRVWCAIGFTDIRPSEAEMQALPCVQALLPRHSPGAGARGARGVGLDASERRRKMPANARRST